MYRLLAPASIAGMLMAAACSSQPGSQAAPLAAESHSTTGVIVQVQQDGKVLVINHKDFPGFMEAMTMPFDVDPKLSQGLKAGDRVKFTITKTGDSWPITAISKE